MVLRLRQIISGTFDHAIATLRADTNPAAPIPGAFKTPKTTHKTPLTRPQKPRSAGAGRKFSSIYWLVDM